MSLRVIGGGVRPDEPPPIVWNRLPLDGQRRALVIRDASPPAPGLVDLAWDDGRAFLVGIRSLRLPAAATALEAWKLEAELIKAVIRDERADPFEAADRANEAQAKAAALERARRDRESRREMQPLAPGGLFDECRRGEQDLF